jgi:hypothetical protein
LGAVWINFHSLFSEEYRVVEPTGADETLHFDKP